MKNNAIDKVSKKEIRLFLLCRIEKIEYTTKPGITIILVGWANTDKPRNKPPKLAKYNAFLLSSILNLV